MTGEVPRCSPIACGTEHVKSAGEIGVIGGSRPTHKSLAVEVGIAFSVPGDRCITAHLPVLARDASEAGSIGESDRDGAFSPVLATIAAECAITIAIARAIIVEARNEVSRMQRVLSKRGICLHLSATLQVGIGDVQTVLTDSDVAPQVPGTASSAGGREASVTCGRIGMSRVLRRIQFGK